RVWPHRRCRRRPPRSHHGRRGGLDRRRSDAARPRQSPAVGRRTPAEPPGRGCVLIRLGETSSTRVQAAQSSGRTPMIDEAVWEGVNALLDDYAMIGEDDVAIVAYTPDSRQSAAWVSVALESRGIPVTVLPMAPLRDDTLA